MSKRLQSFAVAAALLAALVAGGCGDGSTSAGETVASRSSGDLEWAEQPLVFAPPSLPEDRVLYGKLHNPTNEMVKLDIEDVRLRDGRGELTPATGRFLASFTHRLQPYNKPAGGLPRETRLNSGLSTEIPAGGDRPITLSWKAGDELHRIVEVVYDGGSLTVPEPREVGELAR